MLKMCMLVFRLQVMGLDSSRKTLVYFSEYDVNGHLLLAVRSSYSCTEICVWGNSMSSKPFALSSGIRQGCVMCFCHHSSSQPKLDRHRTVASGGASGARPPHLKSVPPFHVWPFGCYINPILYLKNMAPPSGFWTLLLVFGPPTAKSWRRAWIGSRVNEGVIVGSSKINRLLIVDDLVLFESSQKGFPHAVDRFASM